MDFFPHRPYPSTSPHPWRPASRSHRGSGSWQWLAVDGEGYKCYFTHRSLCWSKLSSWIRTCCTGTPLAISNKLAPYYRTLYFQRIQGSRVSSSLKPYFLTPCLLVNSSTNNSSTRLLVNSSTNKQLVYSSTRQLVYLSTNKQLVYSFTCQLVYY